MSSPPDVSGRPPQRWYQGVDRYCWIVLVVAALGWLFDTMDQNLFNLVRAPSISNLLRPEMSRWEVSQFALQPPDLRNVPSLVSKLRTVTPTDAVSRHLQSSALSPETRRLLNEAAPSGSALQAALAGDLDRVVHGSALRDPALLAGLKLRPETQALLTAPEGSADAVRLNRLVLEDAYAGDLATVLDKETAAKGALITAIFLLGWSAGGFAFGILGDRLGRTGTMMVTILIYAVFTGLSGSPLVHSWREYAVMRFLTALGVGGEWAAGAALVAEVFPARSRPMALGVLQGCSSLGNMMAAVVTRNLGVLEQNWRIAYFIGAAPALLVLWIRMSVREPQQWRDAKAKATLGNELGNIGELFTRPVLRRNTLAATLMATAGVGALWGVGFFSTDLLRSELLRAGLAKDAGMRISDMFLLQNLGAFFGILAFSAFAERKGRRSAFFLWFALAWASVLAFFWGVAGAGTDAFGRAVVLAPIMGFCTLGPFAGYTLYFPELFPTRLRATGCGFCYNAARILAALAPFALGKLNAVLGGYAPAATVVTLVYVLGFLGTWLGPETRGKTLPA